MTETQMRAHGLTSLDNRPVSESDDEIRAFITERDEMLRLPHNLDHHRRIGVSRSFVIDNTRGAAGFASPYSSSRIFRNIALLAARGGDYFFRCCITSITYSG